MDKLKEYAREINIDVLGICDAEFNKDLYDKLMMQKNLGYATNLQSDDILKRSSPKLILDNAKSVIVIGMGYNNSNSVIKNLKPTETYFCSSSFGLDYHVVLKEALLKIKDYLFEIYGEFNYVVEVDTGYLDDRYMAVKAGIGYYGKNHLVINEKLGSDMFIGSLIVDIDLPKDKPIIKTCIGCNLCIEKCPGMAIEEEFLNTQKCVSYITQKKEINEDEKEMFANCLYGCDVCRNVCPHNTSNETPYFNLSGVEIIDTMNYSSLSNKEFKKKYGHLAGSYRGRNIIERNINIIKERNEKSSSN